MLRGETSVEERRPNRAEESGRPLEGDGEGEAEGGVGGSADDDDGQRVGAQGEQVVGEDDVAGEHALHQQEAADDEHLLQQIYSTLAFFALPPQHFAMLLHSYICY